MASKKDGGNYRDAGDGRFVTERYADKHPKTTVHESPVKSPPKSPPPKKGK